MNVRDELGPKLRSFKEICDELENPTVAASIILSANAETKIEIWNACLEWVTQLDKPTLEKRQAKL